MDDADAMWASGRRSGPNRPTDNALNAAQEASAWRRLLAGSIHAMPRRPKAIYYALLVLVVTILLLVGGWVADAIATGIVVSLVAELVWSMARTGRVRRH